MYEPEYKPRSPGGWLLKQLQRPKDGIYFIAGHGADNPGVEKKIPKGCKYCTFAECGFLTYGKDPRIVYVEKEFMKGNHMFERPTLVNKFLDKISKEHRSEINNRSQIRNKKSSISIKNYSKNFQKIPKNYTAERARHTYTLSGYSLLAYNESEYNINDLCNDLTTYVLEGDDIDENYVRSLFDKLEFVLERSGIIKFTEEPRDANKHTYYDMFPQDDFDFFYDLFVEYYNSEKSLKHDIYEEIYEEIYKLIEHTLNTSNKDLTDIIKEIFKYSFFPSVDMVLEFYETTTIRNILEFKHHFNRRFNITQDDLFHYLPGTYYNFICRSTNDEDKAMLRRQLSSMNPIGALKTRKMNRINRTRKRKRNKFFSSNNLNENQNVF